VRSARLARLRLRVRAPSSSRNRGPTSPGRSGRSRRRTRRGQGIRSGRAWRGGGRGWTTASCGHGGAEQRSRIMRRDVQVDGVHLHIE
jgi:hypothetical protein